MIEPCQRQGDGSGSMFENEVLGRQVGVECSRLRLIFTRVPNRVLRLCVEYYCVQTIRSGAELISQPHKELALHLLVPVYI